MKKRIFVVCFFTAVVLGLGIEVFVATRPETTGRIYKGRSVGEWVNLCVNKPVNTFSYMSEPGMVEIHELGAEAVPFLTNAITRKPSFTGSRFYQETYASLPLLVSKRFPKPQDVTIVPFRAYCVLAALGPEARSSVPFLVSQFRADNPMLDFVRETLTRLGPDAREAIPALTNGLSSTDRMLRWDAARVLANVAPDYPPLVPMLMDELKNSNVISRRFAAVALIDIQPRTEAITNALREALNDRDATVRSRADQVLNPKPPRAGKP